MALTREEIAEIARATADEVMEQVSLEGEERELRDHLIGGAMGEGAIPLYGRETRKEPCSCCLIDPEGPNTPDNRMCTTKGAIGTLNDREEREWCSEINIVSDGRGARARLIREAARECKEKYPEDTTKFFECYAPAFSKITKGGNPARVRFDRGDIDSATEAAKRLKSDRDLYVFATYLGYTIDKMPPPGMQSYIIVHPDGTTETIKGGNPNPKEPWQMTLEEYAYVMAEKYGHGKPRIEWIKAGYGETYRTHKTAVERALREGRALPAEVLADYPGLK